MSIAVSQGIGRVSAGAGAFKPQLTSLVDVMTILLIFLLKSFSVEGQVLQPAPDLQLPHSTSSEPALPAVSVAVTREAVLVDGTRVCGVDDLALRVARQEPLEALTAALASLTAGAGDEDPERPLTLQCDQGLDFRLLRAVMTTCSEAGFTDFSLLVERRQS